MKRAAAAGAEVSIAACRHDSKSCRSQVCSLGVLFDLGGEKLLLKADS